MYIGCFFSPFGRGLARVPPGALGYKYSCISRNRLKFQLTGKTLVEEKQRKELVVLLKV